MTEKAAPSLIPTDYQALYVETLKQLDVNVLQVSLPRDDLRYSYMYYVMLIYALFNILNITI